MKPIAWIDKNTGKPKMDGFIQTDYDIPLYTHPAQTIWCACGDGITPDSGAVCGNCACTHPAKTLTEIIEKNKPEIEKANAYIKSLEDEIEALKADIVAIEKNVDYWVYKSAKTLTDEEIEVLASKHLCYQIEGSEVSGVFDFARAILRKAQEK